LRRRHDRTDAGQAAGVGMQGGRDQHRAVFLLAVLQDGDQGAADR